MVRRVVGDCCDVTIVTAVPDDPHDLAVGGGRKCLIDFQERRRFGTIIGTGDDAPVCRFLVDEQSVNGSRGSEPEVVDTAGDAVAVAIKSGPVKIDQVVAGPRNGGAEVQPQIVIALRRPTKSGPRN